MKKIEINSKLLMHIFLHALGMNNFWRVSCKQTLDGVDIIARSLGGMEFAIDENVIFAFREGIKFRFSENPSGYPLVKLSVSGTVPYFDLVSIDIIEYQKIIKMFAMRVFQKSMAYCDIYRKNCKGDYSDENFIGNVELSGYCRNEYRCNDFCPSSKPFCEAIGLSVETDHWNSNVFRIITKNGRGVFHEHFNQ